MTFHTPVLVKEINQIFSPLSGKTIIDATLGNGGHTINFLTQGAYVFGLDKDQDNLSITQDRIKKAKLSSNFKAILADFKDLSTVYKNHIKKPVDGILFDLGLSLNQQKSKNRGFSFQDELSLDMRLNPKSQNISAKTLINTYTEEQLFEIFSKYGQETHSLDIAKAITLARKQKTFTSANQLANFIKDFYIKKHLSFSKIHPATKIFLALKIAVNNELENLSIALNSSLDISKKNAWIAIISFHSTEDRLVKEFIKNNLKQNKIYNQQKTRATYQEILKNPLSRSALLRSFQTK